MQILKDLDEVMRDNNGASGFIRLPSGGYKIHINWSDGSFEFFVLTISDLHNIQLGIERVIKYDAQRERTT